MDHRLNRDGRVNGGAGAACAAAVAAVVASGCLASQPRSTQPTSRTDPDVAWVCSQHDLLTDLRGRMTFEDVQRTLCHIGELAGRPLDVAALAAGARAEVQRRCDARMTAADAGVGRPPVTIRQLYEVLRGIAGVQLQAPGCSEAAMIAGMVRVLGDEYGFRRVGESPAAADDDGDEGDDDGMDQAPSPSLINRSIVYVKFAQSLAGGRQIVEAALAATRADHAVTGLILDLRGADGASVAEMDSFLDLFVDDGVVMEMRSRRTGEISRVFATRRPVAEAAPLILLVDDKTHSGAEAFAGGLRARGRALLMGRRTAGHAIVHTTFELPSRSLLNIPVSDLLEPGGGAISGHGVTPDIEVGAARGPDLAGDADEVVRLAAQVLLAARSPVRADLLGAAQRILALRGAPR